MTGNGSAAVASAQSPASARRLNAAARLLIDPGEVMRVVDRLDDAELSNLGEVVSQIQSRRAVERGDLDAIIAGAFEVGFGNDGLGHLPWVEDTVVVLPGGLVESSRANHNCRFASINDTWVWECHELIREDKRSTPGLKGGFRAVALVPGLEGMEIDVVSARSRGGRHSVDRVVSYTIRRGELVEVSQRDVGRSAH